MMTGVIITSVIISQPWNITAIAASNINMKYSGDETADSAVNDPLLKQRRRRRGGRTCCESRQNHHHQAGALNNNQYVAANFSLKVISFCFRSRQPRFCAKMSTLFSRR